MKASIILFSFIFISCVEEAATDFGRTNLPASGEDFFTYQVIDPSGFISDSNGLVKITAVNICRKVKRLSIFRDSNLNGIIDENEELVEVNSFVGNLSAATNYIYSSASAHPIIGPTPGGFAGNVFLYEGNDSLTLNMFFNVDNGAELSEVNNCDENYDKKYSGKWHYWTNTDGDIIGPFSGTEFEIKVKMLIKGDVNDINFHSSATSDNVFLVSDADETETTFFLKYATSTECVEL